MPAPILKFEVDWDHDLLYANANSNITGDVTNKKPWTWGIGRAGSSALTQKSKAGKLTLPLLNDDGLYSSLNSSGALFGKLGGGKRVRVQMGSRAAQFVLANTEYLSIADNASLSTGDIDFYWAGWVYLDSKAADMSISGKWTTGNNEWFVNYDTSSDRFRFHVSSDGSDITSENADNLGAVSTGVWYFIVVWHDATANTINIQVNDGTVDSQAYSSGLTDGTSPFNIGARQSGVAPFDGRIAASVFGKEVPTTAERTWYYNVGDGRTYQDTGRTGDGSDLRTNMEAWWELDEESGTRVDSHGSNDLTDNNTVTAADGLTNRLLWSGRLDKIIPAADIGKIQSATLTALGNLATAASAKPRTSRRTSILSGAAVEVALDDISWPASTTGARDVDAGQTTLAQWTFAVSGKTSAVKEIQKVEDTELGWFRESERDDLVFEDRHRRLSGARLTSQRTYADDGTAGAILYQKIPQSDPVEDVYNRVTAKVPNESLASLSTLWTLGLTGVNSPLVGPGETITILAEYPGPGDTKGDIGAVWTTLVENTDYEANSASDGSGTDLSGSLTLTLTKGLDIMVIQIANGHATLGAYITLLQARGQAVQDGAVQKFEESDSTSITNHDEREYHLPAQFIPTAQEAIDQVRYVLALNKDIAPKMGLGFKASADYDHLKEASVRRLSDRITVKSDSATKLGIDEDFFVEGIQYTVTEGVFMAVVLTLSAVAKVSRVIVLDTGPGLDTGILGY